MLQKLNFKLTKGKKVLIGLAALLCIAPLVAGALTPYFETTSNYTIGIGFQVGTAIEGYNNLVPSTYTISCTLTTAPVWTCPSLAPKLFGGDTISYSVTAETDRPSITPTVVVSAGSFSAYTVNESYLAIAGAAASQAGTFTAGYPTMTSGQWYAILTTITINPSAPTGSVSFNIQLQST